jgi:hypothetical protein
MRSIRLAALGLAVLVVVAVGLSACATTLKPAPGAPVVEGSLGRGAIAEGAGVRLIAWAGAWRASPRSLEAVVTPVLVSVENRSQVPLRLRHSDFALVGPAGQTFAARSPFEVVGHVAEPAGWYASPRFYAGPFVVRDVRGRPFLIDPLWDDPFFYGPAFTSVELPSGDMVQLALPERVVEPHGSATGFLYFERVRKVPGVDLSARLVDDRSGQPVVTLTVPFVVD